MTNQTPGQFSLEAQIIEAPKATPEDVYAPREQSAHVGVMIMAAAERRNQTAQLETEIARLSAGCRAHENLRDEYEVANIVQGAHGNMLRERKNHRVGSEKFINSVVLYTDKAQAVLDLFMAGKKNFAAANGIDVMIEKRPLDPKSSRTYTHVEAADPTIEKTTLEPEYRGFRKMYDPADPQKAEASFTRQRTLQGRIEQKQAELNKIKGSTA